MRPLKLSVTIITLNESRNIERAINSVLPFAHEIVIVDSGSIDKTIEIARSFGSKIKIFEHKFEGYGQQKSYAAQLCESDWILNIDADEEVSEELCQSITNFIKSYGNDGSEGTDIAGMYRFARLNFHCGRPIYHGGWYPDYNIRLYNKKIVTWTAPFVHEELKYKQDSSEDGFHRYKNILLIVGTLNGDLYHYTFQDVDSQVKTNIKYAKLGSKKILSQFGYLEEVGEDEEYGSKINLLIKFRLILEIIFHPIIKFFECYIVKLGFLDGIHGFIIAVNAAHSIFMKYYFTYIETIECFKK
ncbi:MAG: glycosyltransferase family 2 protein [Oligoflexia bacterium]|nr:glycosyltransferase family 2 protein [Oligoflexia bacterium]